MNNDDSTLGTAACPIISPKSRSKNPKSRSPKVDRGWIRLNQAASYPAPIQPRSSSYWSSPDPAPIQPADSCPGWWTHENPCVFTGALLRNTWMMLDVSWLCLWRFYTTIRRFQLAWGGASSTRMMEISKKLHSVIRCSLFNHVCFWKLMRMIMIRRIHRMQWGHDEIHGFLN